MNLKVQTTPDATKAESVSRAWSSPSPTQRVPKVSQAADLESLSKKGELKEEPDRVEVESAVESINNAVEHINRALRFSIHEDTQRMMVRVVDVVTQEVIKELPPEEVLDTVARIREMIGLLIDERA